MIRELGDWITNNKKTPFYTRKIIRIKKNIKSATVNVCGLGQFIFYINGKKQGNHELDPGWTNYNKYIQYVTFDVKEALINGENVFAAEIGNGWYIKDDTKYTFKFPEFMPPNPNPYKPFGKYLIFAMKLEIVYEDDKTETFYTDDSWKVIDNPVTMSNVYGSEVMDAGKKIPLWNDLKCDEANWKAASLVKQSEMATGVLLKQTQPAIEVIDNYKAKYLEDVDLKAIYDLTQNISGILEFDVFGKAGDIINVYPAEKRKKNGDVDQEAKNWVNVDVGITYIIGKDDTWEHFRMKFTYFAGRYLAIEKISTDEHHNIVVDNIKADAISSAHKQSGSFQCDEPRYQKIYDMICRTVEANMMSVHTDCPTIERFAWQEQNHLMAPSIFYMFYGKEIWSKIFMDMRFDQHKKDDYFFDLQGEKYYPGEGLVPAQCPCYIPNVLPVPGLGDFYDIIAWGSACIIAVYWHYQFYGDINTIRDNYEMGKKYFEHLKTKVTKDGFISHGLGDWGNPQNILAKENIETAFYFADAKILSEFATLLGQKEDSELYGKQAEKIKLEYNEKLLKKHPEKDFWCYGVWNDKEFSITQAAEALPLFWGMVPEEKIPDVVSALRYTLEKEKSFQSGEIGLPYVIQMAKKYGMNDLISKFVINEKHPSYYAFILDGETTLGEYWETNPRSHCHDMMGHIIEWYYNGVAGIIPLEPGFSKIKICPYLPNDMNEFTCEFQSESGNIKVHVKRETTQISVDLYVDCDISYVFDASGLKETNLNIVCEEHIINSMHKI